MKIVFISDTHGAHHKLGKLEGEMIIHAGDVSSRGSKEEIVDFLDWYKELDFEYKIFIAGNHDFFFERSVDFEIEKLIPKNLIYLNDSGINIKGLNIWGSPIQPWFHDWAFNRSRGVEIKKHWDLIPEDVDILVTHGPPLNILDTVISGEHVGCEDLLNAVRIVKPKLHVFGHIHEDYGTKVLEGIKFINAAVLDENYQVANAPIEIMTKDFFL